jgi:hypothetical protein
MQQFFINLDGNGKKYIHAKYELISLYIPDHDMFAMRHRTFDFFKMHEIESVYLCRVPTGKHKKIIHDMQLSGNIFIPE